MNPAAMLSHAGNTLPIEKPEMMEAFLADLRQPGLSE